MTNKSSPPLKIPRTPWERLVARTVRDVPKDQYAVSLEHMRFAAETLRTIREGTEFVILKTCFGIGESMVLPRDTRQRLRFLHDVDTLHPSGQWESPGTVASVAGCYDLLQQLPGNEGAVLTKRLWDMNFLIGKKCMREMGLHDLAVA